MSPNADGRQNYWSKKVELPISGFSEPEPVLPQDIPNPALWLHIGHGFQMLLKFLPNHLENIFIAHLVCQDELAAADLTEFEDLLPSQELARDFFSRGLRFKGQHLTSGQIESMLCDFSNFVPQLIWDNLVLPMPAFLSVERPGKEAVHLGDSAVRLVANQETGFIEFVIDPELIPAALEQEQEQEQDSEQQQQQQQQRNRLYVSNS